MTASARHALVIACAGLALVLGACSSGSNFTTGTLLGGGSKPKEAAAPPPETPTDRAINAGTTAARAQRCGYVFDPAAVRQGYLAYEVQQGTAGDALAKAEKSYDYTHGSIAKAIANDQDYCTDERTATIKRDLGQVLAGDYTTAGKKTAANVGWWNADRTSDKMDREKIFQPQER